MYKWVLLAALAHWNTTSLGVPFRVKFSYPSYAQDLVQSFHQGHCFCLAALPTLITFSVPLIMTPSMCNLLRLQSYHELEGTYERESYTTTGPQTLDSP